MRSEQVLFLQWHVETLLKHETDDGDIKGRLKARTLEITSRLCTFFKRWEDRP